MNFARRQNIKSIIDAYRNKEVFEMVPRAGIEPARCCHRGILSPLRLPISPPGLFQSGLDQTACILLELVLIVNPLLKFS